MTRIFDLRNLESDHEYICTDDVCVSLSDCLRVRGAMCSASSEKKDQNPNRTSNFAVFLKDKRNITLDFQGHTLFLKGEIQPFFMENCEHIKIQNCVIEYDRSFTTEFEVLESTPSLLRGRLSEMTPCKAEDGNLIPYADTWENHSLRRSICFLQAFNRDTHRGEGLTLVIFGNDPEVDESLPWAKSVHRLRARVEGDEVVLEEEGDRMPVFATGSIVAIGHSDRSYSSVYAVFCRDLSLENLRVINGAGMGIFLQHTHNVCIDGLKMTYDERSHGLISNEADGIHAVSCSGDLILKNSVIEGTLDDAFNIHGNFFQFVSGEGNQITVHSGGSASSEFRCFDVGDEICIYEGATLQGGRTYVIREIRDLSRGTESFTLDRPVEVHHKGDVIENLSAYPNVYMENCSFGKANTHGRFQSRGKIVVKNCKTELPFLLTGDMNFWFESGPVTDMTVEDTTFVTERATIQCIPEFTATEQAPFYHGDLMVTNCSFESEHPLRAVRSRSIRFFRNTNLHQRSMHLHPVDCGRVETDCAEIE